ncbi:hypothetical protein EPR50_G00061970 [Perca flavescens]|uniref:Uncharacterized protein n=1 Tax=Perca flavescens TaxID=8167 RepID=A0A484D8R0_PERFV|nr:hypothetical protein EPR50_G00061970 [Perca flavescens]
MILTTSYDFIWKNKLLNRSSCKSFCIKLTHCRRNDAETWTDSVCFIGYTEVVPVNENLSHLCQSWTVTQDSYTYLHRQFCLL